MRLYKFLPLTLIAICVTPATFAEDLALKSQITNVQPMTGIVLWSDNGKADTDAISLEFRYCGYNDVVQPDGEYDYTKIDKILDEIAGRGHQAVLRFHFAYVGKPTTVPDIIRTRSDYDETVGKSEKKKTSFCDWSNKALQDFTIEFYSRFAKRYDNDRRLAFLQTGFGLWAEYHIYDGPKTIGKTFPSKEFQAKFLKHMNKTFVNLPWSVSIDASDSNYSPVEDNKELLALNFGVFDDSFLGKPHAKENAIDWKILGSDRWKRRPGGGELSYYTRRDQKNALSESGPNGVSFATSARQFHISYMIGNDQPKYRSMAVIKEASLITGYRFKVTSAKRDGSTLILKATNTGIAPFYRDAYFAAGNTRSKTSLKGLLPGAELECVITNVSDTDVQQITIQSDAILKSQTIQFEANLP